MSGYGSTGNGDQTRQTDEYGNPIQKTGGEYGTDGNTGAHVTHTGGGEYGTGGNTGVTHSTGGGEYGTGGNTGLTQSTGGEYGTGVTKDHDKGGILHRSNSSSSSSEDDGQGGRRKKSIVDKIKNKLPGGPKEPASTVGQGATVTPQEGYGHGHGATNTTTAHETYGADGQPEKKGFVEKIKEKLPGSHN